MRSFPSARNSSALGSRQRAGRFVPSSKSQDEHRGVMGCQNQQHSVVSDYLASSPLISGSSVWQACEYEIEIAQELPRWPACSFCQVCLVQPLSLRKKRNIQTSFKSQGLVEPMCSGENIPAESCRSRCEHQRTQQTQKAQTSSISLREAHRSDYATTTSYTAVAPHLDIPQLQLQAPHVASPTNRARIAA